jgi:hypothetical protein
MRKGQLGRSWYTHACAFMDMKWASPGDRRSLAEALVSVTAAMLADSRDTPESKALRKALFHWSFNVTARGHLPTEEADIPNEMAREVAWIARRSLPLRSFSAPVHSASRHGRAHLET